MTTKEKILSGTIEVFNENGLKFTMDDIAARLGMSKKTIYTVFDGKEELFICMVDYLFDSISESKQAVLNDQSLDTLGKIRKILCVMPEGYRSIKFRKLYELREKYPEIYKRVEQRLETGWEGTIELIEQGISEGVIKPVSVPLVKMMMEAALEQFFQRDFLIRNKMTYAQALEQIVNVLVDGIAAK